MGRDRREITIMATVSRHNCDRDVTDDEAWDDLCRAIAALIERPEFESIMPTLKDAVSYQFPDIDNRY